MAWDVALEVAVLLVLLIHQNLPVTMRLTFRVTLAGWKRYEGPWADGLLDLNENRSWQELTNLTLEIRLPPGGLAVSPALQALLKEASSP